MALGYYSKLLNWIKSIVATNKFKTILNIIHEKSYKQLNIIFVC